MNNNERIMQNNKRRSKLSRRLLLQYFLAVIVYIVFLVLSVFIASWFSSLFNWDGNNLVYRALRLIRIHITGLVGILTLIGWILITYYFISKPLRYLDEIVSAAEQLASPAIEPIVLPAAMANTQHELNLVREKALRDARAAKDAEQRKNDLVVYLAHDLKTPLTSVIGYLTLLREESQISEELREKYLSIALDKAERLEDLINEFFEITRFNLTNISLQYSRVNMTRLLEQLTFEFKPMMTNKNLKCKLIAAADIMVKCDANKIQRVLDNLLRNAVFYSFDHTDIEISVVQNNTETIIKFVNHGETISKEKLERIFEQFYRLDTSRSSNSGGAGLGLAIAKEIVEFHHGTITAKSKDEIIEFEVKLPVS